MKKPARVRALGMPGLLDIPPLRGPGKQQQPPGGMGATPEEDTDFCAPHRDIITRDISPAT